MITLCLTFQRTSRLFSKLGVPLYSPISSVYGFQFVHILNNTCYYLTDCSHPSGWEVVSHGDFDLFCLMIQDVNYLFICLLAIHTSFFFCRNVYLHLLLILKLGYLSILSCKSSLILDMSPFTDI